MKFGLQRKVAVETSISALSHRKLRPSHELNTLLKSLRLSYLSGLSIKCELRKLEAVVVYLRTV